jgi:hypothetical protein
MIEWSWVDLIDGTPRQKRISQSGYGDEPLVYVGSISDSSHTTTPK